MRLFALVLLSSLSLPAVAAAEECSDTFYGKGATGYVYKDFDAEASRSPVGQGGITRACGPFAVDVWGSVGSDEVAEEIDLSGFYTTQAGPVRVQLAAQYFAVNLHESVFDTIRDDVVMLYADVSIPFTWGPLTVAPVIRPVQVVGLGEIPSQTFVQPGFRGSLRLNDEWTLDADLRESTNLTFDHSAYRYDVGLAWQATDRTSFRLGVDGAEHTRAIFSLGFSHTLGGE